MCIFYWTGKRTTQNLLRLVTRRGRGEEGDETLGDGDEEFVRALNCLALFHKASSRGQISLKRFSMSSFISINLRPSPFFFKSPDASSSTTPIDSNAGGAEWIYDNSLWPMERNGKINSPFLTVTDVWEHRTKKVTNKTPVLKYFIVPRLPIKIIWHFIALMRY